MVDIWSKVFTCFSPPLELFSPLFGVFFYKLVALLVALLLVTSCQAMGAQPGRPANFLFFSRLVRGKVGHSECDNCNTIVSDTCI